MCVLAAVQPTVSPSTGPTHKQQNPDKGLDEVAKLAFQAKVEIVLSMLGLQGCRDTRVGDNLIRGVSGGEKKRVTVGEMMQANYRAVFMDEIRCHLTLTFTLPRPAY